MIKSFIKNILSRERWFKSKITICVTTIALCAAINILNKVHTTLYDKTICQYDLNNFEKQFDKCAELWLEKGKLNDAKINKCLIEPISRSYSITLLEKDTIHKLSNQLYVKDSLLRELSKREHALTMSNHNGLALLSKCYKCGDRSAVAIINLAYNSNNKAKRKPSLFGESIVTTPSNEVNSSKFRTIKALDGNPVAIINCAENYEEPFMPDIIIITLFAILIYLVSNYFLDRYRKKSILKAITFPLIVSSLASIVLWPTLLHCSISLLLLISGCVVSNTINLRCIKDKQCIDILRAKMKASLFGITTITFSILSTIPPILAATAILSDSALLMLLPIPILITVIEINLISIYHQINKELDIVKFSQYYIAPLLIIIPIAFFISSETSPIVVITALCVTLAISVKNKYNRLTIFFICAFSSALLTSALITHSQHTIEIISEIKELGTYRLSLVEHQLLYCDLLWNEKPAINSQYITLTIFSVSTFVNIILLLILVPHAIYPTYVSDISKNILKSMIIIISTITAISVITISLLSSHIRNESMKTYITQICANGANIDYTSIKKCKELFSTIDLLNLSIYSQNGKLIKTTTQKAPTLIPQRLSSDICDRVTKSSIIKINTNINCLENHSYISAIQRLANGQIMVVHIDKESATNKFHYESDKISMLLILILLLILVFITLFYNHITTPLNELNHNLKRPRPKSKIEFSGKSISSDIAKLIEQYDLLMAELEKQHRYLVTTERERTWNRMIKLIAHEIKNPLTPMLLKTQLMKSKIETNREGWQQEVTPVLSMIEEQIERISILIKKMASSPQEFIGEGLKMDINEFIDQTMMLFNNIDNIEVSSTIKLENRTSYEVYIRKEMIFTVISNIIYNAIDAIKEGGITNGKILVTTIISPSILTIEINNNGPTIPKKEIDKIFAYQHTTKKHGYGVGLYTAEMLLNIAKGSISAISNDSDGTTFKVILPIENDTRG